MANQEDNIKPKKTRSKTRYEKEGLVRVEVDLDFKTYLFLLKLVEKSGYEIDTNVNKREHPNTTRGITGVITQSIVEMCSKYFFNKNENTEPGLDNKQQQAYIFKNRIRAMKINNISNDEILSTISKKIPSYLTITKKLKIEFDSNKSSGDPIPVFKKPQLSRAITNDLEKRNLTKLIFPKEEDTEDDQ
ncbi:MAG: hypothetical protein M0R33_19610 [Methylomonas sp.]|jgi:hypothetical protein|uniref:hypothetical protein n=1 Tax=Methylomonas sp. TaxID=418 RepID=UPI0025F7F2DB|nr:hypothetical protein [Methylomonas sp.]MCK9608653.1 hypothetical protein [Methylomonas sp.]